MKELENAYRLANKEVDPEFDNTSADGLDNETWQNNRLPGKIPS